MMGCAKLKCALPVLVWSGRPLCSYNFHATAVLRSVKETDWRAELETFGKGVADDSHEAQEMVNKGLSSLEHFPKQATAHLPAGLGAGLEGFGEQITGGIDPQVHLRINKVLLARRMSALSIQGALRQQLC